MLLCCVCLCGGVAYVGIYSFLHLQLVCVQSLSLFLTHALPTNTNKQQNRYDTGLKKPNRRVERLNALLGESAYLVQDTFSLADVAVASYLLYVVQFFPTINLTRWPNLVRYMRDCASRPSYQQAFGTNVQSFLLERLDTMMEKEDDNNKKNNNKKLFGMF